MTSEIRANKQTNRVGLGTVEYTNTGIIVSGIVTCTELSGLTALNIAGVGTANTLDINGDIDVDGHTNLDNVSVAGVTTTVGDVTVGSGGENAALGVRINSQYAQIKLPDGQTGANRKGNLSFGDNDDFRIVHDGHHNYITSGTGNIFISTPSANPVNIYNDRVAVTKDLDVTGDLDVDGHTNLDNVSIAGVTTFSGNLYMPNKMYHVGDTDTYLHFDTNTINLHAGGTTGLVVLDSSVRVPTKLGINGAAPQTPLDVIANGSGYAMAIRGRSSDNTAELRFTSNDYGSLYGTIIGGPTYLKFATSGTERLQITSSGTLKFTGQNTSLETAGITHHTNNNLYIRGGTSGLVLGNHDSTNTIHISNSNFIKFETTDGTERFRINSSGNVGIGTNNPQCLLDLSKDISGGVNYVDIRNHHATGGAALRIKTQGTYGSPTYQAILGASDAGGTIRVGAVSNHPFLLVSNNTERLRIDTSGRVLIGSTAKAGDSALQVYTSDRLHPAIRTNSGNSNGYTMFGDAYQADESQVNIGISYSSASLVISQGCKVNTSSDDAYVSSQGTYSTKPNVLRLDTDGALYFLNRASSSTTPTDNAVSLTERFRIQGDGTSVFDVGAPNSSNKVITRFQSDTSRRLDIVWHDSGSLMGFDTPNSHAYIFKIGGSEKLRLESDGDLKHLTSTPSAFTSTAPSQVRYFGKKCMQGSVTSTVTLTGSGTGVFDLGRLWITDDSSTELFIQVMRNDSATYNTHYAKAFIQKVRGTGMSQGHVLYQNGAHSGFSISSIQAGGYTGSGGSSHGTEIHVTGGHGGVIYRMVCFYTTISKNDMY